MNKPAFEAALFILRGPAAVLPRLFLPLLLMPGASVAWSAPFTFTAGPAGPSARA
jgi:hypothetical protein